MRATKHIHGVSSLSHGSMSCVLALFSLIPLLSCGVACRDRAREAVDPIAVPETATAPSTPSQELDWHEIPPINYIRKEIPAAKVPEIRGHHYEALVPDTCNLEERARLTINAMTEMTCPRADYEPYLGPVGDLIPPRGYLAQNGGNCWPRFMEALPLMRIMSGSTQNLQVDKRWAEVILHSVGTDGLIYVPTTGRPWDPATRQGSPGQGEDQYACLATYTGRMLSVLALYYELTGDEIWNRTAKKMVDRLDQLAVKVEDQAIFLKGQHDNGQYYSPGETLPPEAARIKQLPLSKRKALDVTWIVTGLSQYYRVSKYEPAKHLALALTNYIRANIFNADEESDRDLLVFARAGQKVPGLWAGHFHAYGGLAMHALSEFSYASGQMQFARLAQAAYEWAKSAEMGSIPSLGFFPVMQGQEGPGRQPGLEPMEPCNVGDMIAIAVKLTQLGAADYWEDIDQFARNGLIESQVTRPDQMNAFIRKIREGTVEAYIPQWRPQGAKEVPVAYNETVDGITERAVGYFSIGTYPNDLHVGHRGITDICCTGNGARALYYVWDNILAYDKGVLKVNLLMNRTSPWADVDSYIPYKGRVEIALKQSCRLKIRLNNWIDQDRVSCTIGGKNASFSWEGRYIDLGRVNDGQTVTIRFPIQERTEKLRTGKLVYRVTFRGNDVVSVEPRGKNYALYQRDHYRFEQPRYLKTKRFVAQKTVRW